LAPTERTIRVVIQGRVQGVRYRGWTVETARTLGLLGWVRNLRDGSVEAAFAGPEAAVEAMLEHCRRGPPAARVHSVSVKAWDGPTEPGFRQLPNK